jgi:hypothetical protein
MIRRPRHLTIRVLCPMCAVIDIGPDDLYFAVADDVIEDAWARCRECGSRWYVSGDPSVLALLRNFGVHNVYNLGFPARTLINDERAVLSLRLLLDDPRFVERLAASRTRAKRP